MNAHCDSSAPVSSTPCFFGTESFALHLQYKYGLVLVISPHTKAVLVAHSFSEQGMERSQTLSQLTVPVNKCTNQGFTCSDYIEVFVCPNEKLADSEWGPFETHKASFVKFFPHILPE